MDVLAACPGTWLRPGPPRTRIYTGPRHPIPLDYCACARPDPSRQAADRRRFNDLSHKVDAVCHAQHGRPRAELAMIFETLDTFGHEQVVFCHNKDAGLKAIIAIHNTVLGPALGGTRMWPYATEAEALKDVLRLSRGMTYKNAVAGLDIGGGKAVIIGDPASDKSEALFRAFGKFVDSLGGRYITAEDVGIDVNDMEYVFRETEYVTGVHQVHGGSGDPSPFTAYGTMQGLMAALNFRFGNEDVGEYSYAVQGVGHVGMEFVRLLREQNAKVWVTDINQDLVKRAVEDYGAEAVGLDDIYDVPADVYSPCALGGTV